MHSSKPSFFRFLVLALAAVTDMQELQEGHEANSGSEFDERESDNKLTLVKVPRSRTRTTQLWFMKFSGSITRMTGASRTNVFAPPRTKLQVGIQAERLT
jgi:hypothetical protein